jgi:large subunit ribosomal protein L21
MSLASILRWCKSSFARPRRSLSHNPSASPLRCAASRAIHTTGAVEPNSTTAALQLIRSQPSQYVVASFAGRKYILTPRDMLTVPHLRDVKVGDVLVLDEIHELGSREYTLRGNPVIPPNTVKVEATVVEHTKGKMEFIFKKKRRKGYRKTIQHKQPYTRIRIGDIEIPI